jgi:hypothetical protein
MSCFWSVLARGSVSPLIYGRTAIPADGAFPSTSSKNDRTNSSGLAIVLFLVFLSILKLISSDNHLMSGLWLHDLVLFLCFR